MPRGDLRRGAGALPLDRQPLSGAGAGRPSSGGAEQADVAAAGARADGDAPVPVAARPRWAARTATRPDRCVTSSWADTARGQADAASARTRRRSRRRRTRAEPQRRPSRRADRTEPRATSTARSPLPKPACDVAADLAEHGVAGARSATTTRRCTARPGCPRRRSAAAGRRRRRRSMIAPVPVAMSAPPLRPVTVMSAVKVVSLTAVPVGHGDLGVDAVAVALPAAEEVGQIRPGAA